MEIASDYLTRDNNKRITKPVDDITEARKQILDFASRPSKCLYFRVFLDRNLSTFAKDPRRGKPGGPDRKPIFFHQWIDEPMPPGTTIEAAAAAAAEL